MKVLVGKGTRELYKKIEQFRDERTRYRVVIFLSGENKVIVGETNKRGFLPKRTRHLNKKTIYKFSEISVKEIVCALVEAGRKISDSTEHYQIALLTKMKK
jgi:hypothetical protein